MTIADHPLHRSGRAALPHPAPALGDDAKAHERPGVADASGWQPALDVLLHTPPRQVMGLGATLQCAPPEITNCLAEEADARAVVGHAEVLDVAGNDTAQISPLLRDGVVQAAPKLLLQSLELGLQPLA